ncbi:MAG TPA: CTP synthase [Candidatus Krumholzibacteria bacterium]|nr:CTP synthase [Candidatus Krumholzibacteria bacterium]HPD71282.1 CTP synthase [Candidatus Krumholzibacteria bacterium]HRY39018.1 CTP synthase [Candidatus Krumholzibacteria bacterium]
MAKYIFVTGGVVSALGKGIAAATLGNLLTARGLQVVLQKFDPYLNVDPGTMSPYQHGEVFVLDDGAECDLDLGHYERFTDVTLSQDNNLTAGKVYETILYNERKGKYLGRTVQVIPHVTDEIKRRIVLPAQKRPDIDVVITEIGGTVGDIESLPFLEAIRQLRLEQAVENTCSVHLTLVPYIDAAGEIKTKPTQHSVAELRSIGIQADFIICRSRQPIGDEARRKIALFCNLPPEYVFDGQDVRSIYEVPLNYHAQKMDDLVCKRLRLEPPHAADLAEWERMTRMILAPPDRVRIAIVGKYVELKDAYKSITESFVHAGIPNHVGVDQVWIDSESLEGRDVGEGKLDEIFKDCHGVLVPGGFGDRGIQGKINASRYAREREIPFFGICLGLQCAMIDIGRDLAGLAMANSSEFDPATPHAVIHLMEHQQYIEMMGGTMRLGAWPCAIKPGTLAHRCYGRADVSERHRHRYEVNNAYRPALAAAGVVFSGTSPDEQLVEIMELPSHPFFLAVQFHPELKSRPNRPHPLFREFVRAAVEHQERIRAQKAQG